MPDAIMIFAAGFGTRMGALTKSRPKALVEVAGEPLLDRAIADARSASVTQIVVNTHFLANQIHEHLKGTDIKISHEEPDILDTGGGLKAALPLLGPGPVLTSNSDAVFSGPNPVRELIANGLPNEADAVLLLVPLGQAIGRMGGGDFDLASDGQLSRAGDFVYTGIQIIRTTQVASWPDAKFSLNQIWDKAASKGRLFGAVYPGRWCDVGHPEGLSLAEALVAGSV